MKNKYSKNLIILSIVAVFLFSLGINESNLVSGMESEEYSFVSKMGSKGSGDGQFDTPHTMAFDPSGNMYITDTKNARVQKFDSNGTFLSKWGSRGTGDGQFLELEDIELDSFDNVYVSDRGTASIQSFTKVR